MRTPDRTDINVDTTALTSNARWHRFSTAQCSAASITPRETATKFIARFLKIDAREEQRRIAGTGAGASVKTIAELARTMAAWAAGSEFKLRHRIAEIREVHLPGCLYRHEELSPSRLDDLLFSSNES